GMTPEDQGDEFVPLMVYKTRGFLEMLSLAMGDDDWATFIPSLLDKYRYKSISMADFKRELGKYSKEDIAWLVDQFVNEPIMPGYVIANAEAYEIDSGERERQFQTIVRIDNLEEGGGFVKLIYELDESAEEETIERDVYLASNESKEIRMVLYEKPEMVRLHSPYSRNVQDPTESLYVPDELRAEAGETSELTVEALDTGHVVIVDDLDAGFSTVKLNETPRKREDDPNGNSGTQEYPRFNGFIAPKKWQETTSTGAYGKYERTRKIKRAGDGNELAVWTASLEQAGSYEVFFHTHGTTRGAYKISVESGDTTREIELELNDAKGGWNSLGKYDFEAGAEARVTLSDEIRNASFRSRIYADAVKWELQDTADLAQ
ncbi:MAG: hypothetical protein VCB26_03300, partial [Candidatus Hydrogenedentota bacterium]